MKKMIENTCMRPVFSYNKIRKKNDGVSMGPLVLVLDNIIIKIYRNQSSFSGY